MNSDKNFVCGVCRNVGVTRIYKSVLCNLCTQPVVFIKGGHVE